MKASKEQWQKDKKKKEKKNEHVLIALGIAALIVVVGVSAFFAVRALINVFSEPPANDESLLLGTWATEDGSVVWTFERLESGRQAEIIVKETPTSGKITRREYLINETKRYLEIADGQGDADRYYYTLSGDDLTLQNKAGIYVLHRGDDSLRYPPAE